MRSIDTPQGIRFGLYVFIFLIFFCLAQLTWWIIYQLDLHQQLYQSQVDLLTLKTATTTEQVNNDFGRMVALAGYAYRSSGEDRAELAACMNNLLSDRALLGYVIASEPGHTIVIGGKIDSTFYHDLGIGLTLFFDPDYPRRLIGDPPDLIFAGEGYRSGDEMKWVQPEMFRIAPEVSERIESESQRGSKMFVFEGGFFMLIVLFGAYLIYRTLQKSEDLKARQVNFIHSVTHEFRTPLTSIRLYLETLQSGRIEASRSQDIYTKMLNDCDRIDSMVDNVLEAGHFGREKYELELSEADLAKDIEDYINDLKPYIERQNATLESDLEENVRIQSDYNALGRAIRALIDNAMKYSPPDRRIISVTLKRSGRKAEMIVADQGIGISGRELKKIFDRFYRIEDAASAGEKGTGLGLYLVRHIIKAHGGTITVESRGSGQGTRFIIKLPLVKR